MKIKSLFFATLLISSAIPFFTSCEKTPKAPQKQVGLQLYSIREDMGKDAKVSIDSVSNIGYSFVEAANYGDGKFYGMPPAEFADYLKSKNLVFLSSHIGRDVPTEENYDETMAWWDQAVADHKAAGVKYIVQPWMSNIGYDSLEGLKRYCEYFNAVGEKCNAAGIKFGYHNHSGEFKEIDGQVIYDFMLQNTDPNKVFSEMDVYWATKGGVSPAAYFEKYP
jgi:Sugar phosphate isomerases/epimerases